MASLTQSEILFLNEVSPPASCKESLLTNCAVCHRRRDAPEFSKFFRKIVDPAPLPHHFSNTQISLCCICSNGYRHMLLDCKRTSDRFPLSSYRISVEERHCRWLLLRCRRCIFQHFRHKSRTGHYCHCASYANPLDAANASFQKISYIYDLWNGHRVSILLYITRYHIPLEMECDEY